MSRLIDADTLGLTDFEIITCDGSYKEALKILLDKIQNAPMVDVVPTEFHDKCMKIEIQKRFDLELNSERVIRCKDCIYYDMEHQWCAYWEDMDMQPNDFCSKGERKEDEKRKDL